MITEAARQRKKAYMKEWRKQNRIKCNTNLRKWQHENPQKVYLSNKAWHSQNREQYNKILRDWNKANPEKKKGYQYKYSQANPGKCAAKVAKYRATKFNATPKWLTKEQLKEMELIYINCPSGYHVDHIYPLQSDVVCGLHVPWNLQYLPAKENISKGNKLKELRPVGDML